MYALIKICIYIYYMYVAFQEHTYILHLHTTTIPPPSTPPASAFIGVKTNMPHLRGAPSLASFRVNKYQQQNAICCNTS